MNMKNITDQLRESKKMGMTTRERAKAVLNYESYDRLPIVHFGFWDETLVEWAEQGIISSELARSWKDGNAADHELTQILGFDCNWHKLFRPNTILSPGFEPTVLRELPDGSKEVLSRDGVINIRKDGVYGILPIVDTMLKGRKEWEKHYLPRLQFSASRVESAMVETNQSCVRFDEGGREYLQQNEWDEPYGLFCGSLCGEIRCWLGVENFCYLQADDPSLFDEIVSTVADLCYQCTRMALESGAQFDFAHFWEDICFKNGPLISPSTFDAKFGPHYRRITELLASHDINIVSLDCDGFIDALIPTWFRNGVNTMFPIEVGTWGASIGPWRKQYGKELRGIGGVEKKIFSEDRDAIDHEPCLCLRLVDRV